MKNFKPFISLGLLLLLLAANPFTSCQKSYLTQYIPFIELRTNPVISDSGIEITGLVSNETDHAIIHYGFEWRLSPNKNLLGYYKQTSENFTGKQFSHLIDYALPKSDSIIIRAFIETPLQTIESSPVTIQSKGSLPPEIDIFYPKTGTQGDTLYIEGSRFPALEIFDGFSIGHILLTIGDTRAFVLESTYNRMKALVPHISTQITSIFEVKLQIHDYDIIIGDFEYINSSTP